MPRRCLRFGGRWLSGGDGVDLLAMSRKWRTGFVEQSMYKSLQ